MFRTSLCVHLIGIDVQNLQLLVNSSARESPKSHNPNSALLSVLSTSRIEADLFLPFPFTSSFLLVPLPPRVKHLGAEDKKCRDVKVPLEYLRHLRACVALCVSGIYVCARG